MIGWRHLLKHVSLTRIFFVALGICTLSLVFLAYCVSLRTSSTATPRSSPTPLSSDLPCLGDAFLASAVDHGGDGNGINVRTEPRVLVLVETPYTRLGQAIVVILESVRYKHRVQVMTLHFSHCYLTYLLLTDLGWAV